MTEPAVEPKPGGWVLIRAKVLDLHPNGVGLNVQLFSKTAQYQAFVRRDLCEVTDKPIPAEPDDGSVALLGESAYQRIGSRWASISDPAGVSWEELNQRGDVEVIHHA